MVNWRLTIKMNVLKTENLKNGSGGNSLLGNDASLRGHDILSYDSGQPRARQDGGFRQKKTETHGRRNESGEEEDERETKDGFLDPTRFERLGFPRTKDDEKSHSEAEEASRSLIEFERS